jgi:two-component sensor histidine kinase
MDGWIEAWTSGIDLECGAALATWIGWGVSGVAGALAGWLGCDRVWRRRMAQIVRQAAAAAAAQTRQEVVHEVRMVEHAHLQSSVLEAWVLVRRAADSPALQAQAWLREADLSLQRLLRLVKTLHRRAAAVDPALDDRVTPGDVERTVVEVCKNLRTLGMQISVERLGPPRRDLPAPVVAAFELVLYNSVVNAWRHGRATRLLVQIAYASDQVELRVSDNGRGFCPTASQDGRGIRDMRARMRQVHGVLEILSTPGHGATIVARAPLPSAPLGADGSGKEEPHDVPSDSAAPLDDSGRTGSSAPPWRARGDAGGARADRRRHAVLRQPSQHAASSGRV